MALDLEFQTGSLKVAAEVVDKSRKEVGIDVNNFIFVCRAYRVSVFPYRTVTFDHVITSSFCTRDQSVRYPD